MNLRHLYDMLTHKSPPLSPVGRYATVTTHGDITPLWMGEVRVQMGGGLEYFAAKAADGEASIMADEEVVIVGQEGPRTVIVARATD